MNKNHSLEIAAYLVLTVVDTYASVQWCYAVAVENCCRDFRPMEYLLLMAVRVKTPCTAEASQSPGSGKMIADTGDHTASSTVALLRWFLTLMHENSHFYYTRKQICFQCVLAIAIPSVRPSVCPSHGWIRQKRSKLGSSNPHHRLPGRL